MLSLHNRKSFILVFITVLGIPLLFLDTTLSMVNVWMVNETFTHGFLVFPLSIWLVWQKKDKLFMSSTNPEPKVFTLLLFLICGWFIASVVDVQVVQQFFMIAIIIASIWTVLGRQILTLVLFPLLFLFFAVPFGQSLIPPLMEFTANFTVLLIQLSGIPVFREGLFFSLPSGSWSVVEECSGVRYLIASFTLGSLYAYLSYSSLSKRLVFVFLSLIVPVIGNGLRAYGIVMIGHFSGMELAVGADHLLYGWVFFGAIIFLLFYIGSFWWDPIESFQITSDKITRNPGNGFTGLPIVFLTLIFVLIGISVLFSMSVKNNKLLNIKPASLTLPENFSGWQYAKDRSLEWRPIFHNPDTEISQNYYFGNDLVQLNIGYYQAQRQGAEVISTMNRIASPLGGEWKKIKSSEINENGMYFIETELRNSRSNKVLVWHWYRIGQYVTPNPYIAKVLDAFNLIVKGRTDASMITVSTRLDEDKGVSRQRIIDFWSEASGETNLLLEILPGD